MKPFITSIFITLLTLQAFNPLVVYTTWFANRGYVAAVLCENRDQPKLHCDGHCVLKKKLRQAEEESPDKQGAKVLEAFQYIAASPDHTAQPDGCIPSPSYALYPPNHYACQFRMACFRPPGV